MGLFLFLIVVVVGKEDVLKESLILRPLPDGKLMSHFSFRVSSVLSAPHFRLVPRSLGQLLALRNVTSLSVSLGSGRWLGEQWGLSSFPVSEGLLVSSRLPLTSWQPLLFALDALLGVSASLIGRAASVQLPGEFCVSSTVVAVPEFVGAAGAESLCTENLTPWLAMLPCRDRAGLGAVLDPLRFLAAPHHALGLAVKVEADGSLDLVFDAMYVSHPSTVGVWNAQTLFGKQKIFPCGVAADTHVHVDASLRSDGGTSAGVYVVNSSSGFDFSFPTTRLVAGQQRGVSAIRFLIGHGLDYGGVKTIVTNHGNADQSFSLLDLVPWQFRVKPRSVRSSSGLVSSTSVPEREGMSVVKVCNATVAARSTVEIVYEFEKAFLHLSEHPPNAHHGFYFPGGKVVLVDGGVIFTEGGNTCFSLFDLS
jgi:phosphatidylinositol glycan class T